MILYYGPVLVAMVPFDVPRELYAHNIHLDKVYIIGLDSYFSRFVSFDKGVHRTGLCLASTIDITYAYT